MGAEVFQARFRDEAVSFGTTLLVDEYGTCLTSAII